MKGKVSYHWVIVGALFAVYAATTGISTNCYNALSPAIMKEGYAAGAVQMIPLAMTISMLVVTVVLPKLLQKLGFKLVITAGAIACAAAMAMRTFSHSLGAMFFWGIIQGGGASMLAGVPFGLVLTNWFHEKRGTAMGIATTGSAIGGFIFVQLTNMMIANVGWRTANLVLAVITIVILLPICLFVLKETPEERGLLPYGMTEEDIQTLEEGDGDAIRGITMEKFLKTPACWWTILAFVLLQFSTMGVYNNINIFLQTEAGHTAMFAGTVYAIVVLSQAPGKVLVGWIHDKFGIVIGSSYGLILGALFFVFLMMSGNPAMAVIMGIIFGMRNALSSVMPPYMTAYIVGRRDYARIYSLMMVANALPSSLGPIFAGRMYDLTGSFNLAWIVFGIMFVLVFFVSIIAFRSGEGMDEM